VLRRDAGIERTRGYLATCFDNLVLLKLLFVEWWVFLISQLDSKDACKEVALGDKTRGGVIPGALIARCYHRAQWSNVKGSFRGAGRAGKVSYLSRLRYLSWEYFSAEELPKVSAVAKNIYERETRIFRTLASALGCFGELLIVSNRQWSLFFRCWLVSHQLCLLLEYLRMRVFSWRNLQVKYSWQVVLNVGFAVESAVFFFVIEIAEALSKTQWTYKRKSTLIFVGGVGEVRQS